jgi:hypothetical protein
MEKRLTMLSDALNNDEVSAPVADQLLEVVKALEAGNYTHARDVIHDLFTKSGGGQWMVGVRRLVETVAIVKGQQTGMFS